MSSFLMGSLPNSKNDEFAAILRGGMKQSAKLLKMYFISLALSVQNEEWGKEYVQKRLTLQSKVRLMFEFRSFGSGSSGNAYLFRTEEGCFMIDAGLSTRRIQSYLRETGVSMHSLQALFLTHDHRDHSQSTGRLQLAFKKQGGTLPVYMTEKVLQGIESNPVFKKKPLKEWVYFIHEGETLLCCGCTITPLHIPHDSLDNVGYFIRHGEQTLLLATDVGRVTGELLSYIGKTENLIVEANYDEDMLANGPYSLFLQNRIRGGNGHLSNVRTADLIFQFRNSLRRVWFCHLSEKNNTPRQVQKTMEARFEKEAMSLYDFMKAESLPREVPSKLFSL